MEYKFEEYEKIFDMTDKKADEIELIKFILKKLNDSNKIYSNLDEFRKINPDFEKFKTENNLDNILKHYDSKINQNDYNKILENIQKMEKKKLNINIENEKSIATQENNKAIDIQTSNQQDSVGFWDSKIAGIAYSLGIDDISLDEEAIRNSKNQDRIDNVDRQVQGQIEANNRRKAEIAARIAEPQERIKTRGEVVSAGKATVDLAKKLIRDNKANSMTGKIYNADGSVESVGISKIYSRLKANSEGMEVGKKVENDYDYLYFDTKSKQVATKHLNAGDVITDEIISEARDSAEAYVGLSEDTANFYNALADDTNETVKDSDFDTARHAYTTAASKAGIEIKDDYNEVKVQGVNLNKEIDQDQDLISKDEQAIIAIERENKEIEDDATVCIEYGYDVQTTVKLSEAKDYQKHIKEAFDKKKKLHEMRRELAKSLKLFNNEEKSHTR